jgi:glycosyltransferase involved in cell wall biosynthesis
MKILLVVESINIEDSSASKANVAMINNLQAVGFEVTVFHYTRMNIEIPGVSIYSIQEIKFSLYFILSRLQRKISSFFCINLAPFFENIFGFSFTFLNDVNSIKIALKNINFRPDLVITLSKGASFRPHFAVLKLPKLHSKWLAYIHDPYPFHYYPRPYNWIQSGFKQKELFFLELSKKAKYSGFPSKLLMEWMGSYFPDFLQTGILIPHQNNEYIIQNKCLPNYFDSTKFNLLHAGNLLKQRSPEGLIEGFKLFLKNNPDAKKDARLLIIGPADFHTILLNNYLERLPELYVCNGSVKFDEVYNIQKNVSVNIILESKAEISPFLPAKFPHCVEANKIILSLAPYYSETKRLLGDNYEYWSEVDDVKKIATLIEKLYHKWLIDPQKVLLNRPDLLEYLSQNNLKSIIYGTIQI